jgi:hypothetical protein
MARLGRPRNLSVRLGATLGPVYAQVATPTLTRGVHAGSPGGEVMRRAAPSAREGLLGIGVDAAQVEGSVPEKVFARRGGTSGRK